MCVPPTSQQPQKVSGNAPIHRIQGTPGLADDDNGFRR
jgi:hypothetical protein